ncbi:MAG: imidazolonepropionase [Candidatus Methanoliparum thermophilum]|uniref:Imidazolonepropionase n=1 Tax=Methanoliparum thermophilum TaxID=2491083 RepID=A0A520KR54_METT2|nr:amidohydrolase family protein [Candidatus Methanoliparum sp. LAM-1]RZN63834.1 MAG: imidazolonepropionase [Candidatus Methanoliparum thermophilum]BDC36443.1 amidohydrolase [Candidatus Methanoliparum sp. LAM-1]
MKSLKAALLYDGINTKKDVYIVFNKRIVDITDKKPDCEIIGEGIVTPAFIDGHCHIGLERSGEPYYEGETNDELQPISPLNNVINSIYMDDLSFKESLEFGVLYSHVMPGSGNIIGGRTALIRNWRTNIEDALFCEIGIKAALGYNPRSTHDWKGERPTTRMGAIGLLRRELYKAIKARDLLKKGKKDIEEIDPTTEHLIQIIDDKPPLMVHVHKSDDIIVLKKLADEFGLNVIANHCGDVYLEETWTMIKNSNIPVIYGPIDSFASKVELKHSSWRNIKNLIKVSPKFGLMTDHPVMLQRDLFLQLRHFLRFDMRKERAISLITKETADILGLKDLGTIEEGKIASLLLWDGDPFSLESRVKTCVCEGNVIDIE